MPKQKVSGRSEGNRTSSSRTYVLDGSWESRGNKFRNRKGSNSAGYTSIDLKHRAPSRASYNNARPATTWNNFLERAQSREGTRVPATRNDNTFSNSRSDYSNNGKSPSLK